MTNKEAVENNNVVIFKAEDVNDPTWDYIISVLRENIPGFNVGHGYGNWMAFAVPKERNIYMKRESIMKNVKDLWLEFGDVPMNPETECIETEWNGFPPGTHREEIWHWFEETFHVSVAEDLM